MDGEALGGGHTTAHVVRHGETVHRSRTANSEYVAAVLRHLEAAGFGFAPRYLGFVTDGPGDDGHDVFTHIAGTTTDHPSQRAPGAYAVAGRALRRLHDLTAGHPLARGEQCVMHGDAGPYNTIFRDGRPVAFIDWDSCRPGPRLHDLGYTAWTWCIQSAGTVPLAEQAAHLRELRDAYGELDADALLRAVVEAQDFIERVETDVLSAPGTPTARREHARRSIEWARADRALVQAAESRLREALS